LSFVPEYIAKYPFKRHHNDFYDFDSIMTSNVDFSFNVNNRRHSRLDINNFNTDLKSNYINDFMKHASVRNNSLNFRVDNQFRDAVNVNLDDYDTINNTDNFINMNMYFKYPLGYDYNSNFGDMFLPMLHNKEND